MIKRVNKKAQGLSTNAIILIVLGVIVLAVLIVGFTLGWNNLKKYLGSDSNNVDTIVQACTTACSTNVAYDYCSMNRTLNDGTNKITQSCAVFSSASVYAQYQIDKCPSVSCQIPCAQIVVNGKTATEKPSCDATTEDDLTSIAKVTTTGNKCCLLH